MAFEHNVWYWKILYGGEVSRCGCARVSQGNGQPQHNFGAKLQLKDLELDCTLSVLHISFKKRTSMPFCEYK